MENYTPEQLSRAVKIYESQKKAWASYNERKRQEKKDAGTYRPRGRPSKNADKLFTRNSENPEGVKVNDASIPI